MDYKVLIEKRVEKYLRKLQPKRYQRISELLHDLKSFPDVHADIAPLKCEYPESSYRIRVGDWRILFTVNQELGLIRVWKIDNRGDIY